MTRQLVIDALRMAWFRRIPDAGLIFHSDRGSQYASGDFQKQLKAFEMKGSRYSLKIWSKKGDCWDNAVTETQFGSLKVERLHGVRFATRRLAKDEVRGYRLAALLQSSQNAFDIGLLQPNGFREENASRYQKIWQT